MDANEIGVRHLQVRLSAEEYAELEKAAGDVSLQRFARRLLLEGLGAEAARGLDVIDLPPEKVEIIQDVIDLFRKGTDPDMEFVVRVAASRRKLRGESSDKAPVKRKKAG